ncbi:MAG: signal recognition particle protein [Pirellulaceae bacterium]
MFDSLQESLQSAFKTFTGKGKLTESNMRDGLRLVEQSLLDADVNITVVRDFMRSVTEDALGEKVLLSLQPQEQLIGIVNKHLIQLLGPVDHSLPMSKDVNIIMMCGLQGSGKTTTCGKLAQLLMRTNKIKPLLVAADLQRPAAIEQLHVIGQQLDVPVYSEPGEKDPVKVCRNAVAKARKEKIPLVILDTAGRLAIDQELMEQLKTIDREVQPDQVFLVVDGMTGQDAVNSAGAFHAALELNGVIMTKLDGDARGGALLSVKQVTGVPIKFIGTGEHLDNLELFRPEGMASRILGMGDVLALVEEAQKLVDEKEQQRIQEQLEKGQFTLDDFRDQIQRMAKPGLMMKMLGLLPGIGGQMKQVQDMMGNADTVREMRRLMGIIDSMTPAERKNPTLIDMSRRQRIAMGSGVQAKQVNELIKQYDFMKPMITGMASGNPDQKRQMFERMQEKMVNPGATMSREKKSTGKRLTDKEREKIRKQREKLLRQKKKRQ